MLCKKLYVLAGIEMERFQSRLLDSTLAVRLIRHRGQRIPTFSIRTLTGRFARPQSTSRARTGAGTTAGAGAGSASVAATIQTLVTHDMTIAGAQSRLTQCTAPPSHRDDLTRMAAQALAPTRR